MATTYVVLQYASDQPQEGHLWMEVGTAAGANDLAAIKSLLEKDESLGAGIYRAVPQRSWPDVPHTLKPKVSWV